MISPPVLLALETPYIRLNDSKPFNLSTKTLINFVCLSSSLCRSNLWSLPVPTQGTPQQHTRRRSGKTSARASSTSLPGLRTSGPSAPPPSPTSSPLGQTRTTLWRRRQASISQVQSTLDPAARGRSENGSALIGLWRRGSNSQGAGAALGPAQYSRPSR